MMSSSTERIVGSSRCVYCARPGADLAEVVGERRLQRGRARRAPATRTVPRWLTSNATASSRHARCSASVPVGYASGMSQPPNGDQLGAERAVLGVERRAGGGIASTLTHERVAPSAAA